MTWMPFAVMLLQDFWTVGARDYLALIASTRSPVPIVRSHR